MPCAGGALGALGWIPQPGGLLGRWGVSPIAPSRRAGVSCAVAHLGTVRSPWGPVGAAGRPPPGEGMFSGGRVTDEAISSSLVTKCKRIDSARPGGLSPRRAARRPASPLHRASPARDRRGTAFVPSTAALQPCGQGIGTRRPSAPADFGPVVPAAAGVCRARPRARFHMLLKREHVSVPQFLF